MKYLVFDTEAEALAAEAAISQELGYAKPGVNAATGEVRPDVVTVRWAIPQQIADGRWAFPSPDDEGDESEPSWWPHNEGELPRSCGAVTVQPCTCDTGACE